MSTLSVIATHALVCLFGIGSWIAINGLWVELPILVMELPEGWELGAYLVVIIQLANVGPLCFTIGNVFFPHIVREKIAAYTIIVTGVVACLLLVHFWEHTSYIGDVLHSTSLLILQFFLALVDCTSSVVFLPFMSTFKESFLTTYYIGEGLSGLLPSVVALIQGAGEVKCVNTTVPMNVSVFNSTDYTITNSTKLVPQILKPRFPVEDFFYFLFAMMVVCGISFTLLNHLRLCKLQYAPPTQTCDSDSLLTGTNRNQSNISHSDEIPVIINSQEKGDNVGNKLNNTSSQESDPSPCEINEISREDTNSTDSIPMPHFMFFYLLSLILVINTLSCGILPSVQSYSCLPYGVMTYHYAVTLSSIANPVACCFAFFVTANVTAVIVVLAVGVAMSGYIIGMAAVSPTPLLMGTTAGSVLIVCAQVLVTFLLTYAKVNIALFFRREGRRALLWCGAITQLGSAIGAVIMFVLVSVFKVFVSAPYCDTMADEIVKSGKVLDSQERKKRNYRIIHDDENDDDHVTICCYLESFEEGSEMEALINNLKNISNDTRAMENSFERFRYVMDLYQEQPHLLDNHIPLYIELLLTIGMDKTSEPATVREAFTYLYQITKIRGYKVIVRHLPHEVRDLEPVLAMLNKQDLSDSSSWETRYILLLWLSIICMVPFDMARFDGSSGEGDAKEPIMDRIINVAKMYMGVVSKNRDASAYLLSRFLTRPDVIKSRLPDIMTDAMTVLTSNLSQVNLYTPESNSVLGMQYMLALLYKHGKREDLLTYAPQLLQSVISSAFNLNVNSLLRRGAVKLVQRIGLIFLKQRAAAWRYTRGNRSLADNLGGETESESDSMINTELIDTQGEDYDIPEEIEDVIEYLLNGLKDGDTIVRWSAAKGIGRVCGRLPKDLTNDVLGSILELFSKSETEGAWHGGCLSLAELGRRGLLLPERLSEVIPPVLRALLFDERRGTFSVGANVRDAACYVCWAFARAYDPHQIKPYVTDIANALVIVSLFDREVNVRRAASAAFQENVGRQGSFPHGIDILTKADYFAVGKRMQCYLELSPFVANFPEYTKSVINHVVDIKTLHWDSCIRELSGESLAQLTPKAPDYMANTVVPALLSSTQSSDVLIRHGSIHAVANITHALSLVCAENDKSLVSCIGQENLTQICDVPSKLTEAKRFRGHGGELMRQAVCFLIQKLSHASVHITSATTIDLWQEIVDDNICHKDLAIQAAAVKSQEALTTQYYRDDEGNVKADMQEKVLHKYLSGLKGTSDEQRVGYCLAIGSLPQFMIRGKLRPILSGLIQVTQVNQVNWVDSRKTALVALNKIIKTVGVDSHGSSDSVICGDNLSEIYEVYFTCIVDYTTDSRGDIGRLVREAAITCLYDVSSLVASHDSTLLSPKIVEVMFCLLLQQACEKIDRTREHACATIAALIHHEPPIPHIPEREYLLGSIKKKNLKITNWAAESVSFPKLTPLMQFPVYAYHIILGLTVSVGGITESVVQNSSASLHKFLKKHHTDGKQMTMLITNIITIMDKFHKNDRVMVPMFKMLENLLSQNNFTSFFSQDDDPYPLTILKKCKQEVTKCNNPHKLMAVSDVYCGLLTFENIRDQTLFQLMVMLGHGYPRVRKTTAEKLYEALLTYDDVIEDEHLDEVNELISDTKWDDGLSTLRPIRNHLCELLGIKPPVVIKKSASKTETKSLTST